MQEDFLHYIWKFQKFRTLELETVDGSPIVISNVGQHNKDSGPDFFNSKLRIGEQLWAGNVEIHIKSSDWFVHNHETDTRYDNVILHVVWEHDVEVFRKNNSEIATLELKDLVNPSVLEKYCILMANKDKFINCENDFSSVDDMVLNHWIDRLYIERLERKSAFIFELLKDSNNDWEAVLFKMLAKNFGLKVNGDAFFSMAQSFDFSVLRKIQNQQNHLEALFMGQLQMLQVGSDDFYLNQLRTDYNFIQNKFKLKNANTIPVKYFRLRPPNFPTIRLSQLAMLYSTNSNLFSQIQNLQSIDDIRQLFEVSTSKYWETHFTFKKESKFSKKKLTKAFIDLLLINTIIPLKFCYMKELGINAFESLLEMATSINAENNFIVKGFELLKELPDTALYSQGLIQLKTMYCDKNRCIHCEVGNVLLGR